MYNDNFLTIYENSNPSEQEIKSTKELEHANPALSFIVYKRKGKYWSTSSLEQSVISCNIFDHEPLPCGPMNPEYVLDKWKIWKVIPPWSNQ